jgi:hypothetical protein
VDKSPWWSRSWEEADEEIPPATGNALLTRVSNTRDLLWVDFSAYAI